MASVRQSPSGAFLSGDLRVSGAFDRLVADALEPSGGPGTVLIAQALPVPVDPATIPVEGQGGIVEVDAVIVCDVAGAPGRLLFWLEVNGAAAPAGQPVLGLDLVPGPSSAIALSWSGTVGPIPAGSILVNLIWRVEGAGATGQILALSTGHEGARLRSSLYV